MKSFSFVPFLCIKIMLNKVKQLLAFLRKNKKVFINGFIIILFIRFGFMIFNNWNHGNTGLPGIQYLTDSFRYIGAADKLINNDSLDYKEIQYSGYILLIAFFKLFSESLKGVIIIQLVFALISAYALYQIAYIITGKLLAGFIAISLYLINPFICSWHTYIMTESLYTSFLVISCWSLIRFLERKSSLNLIFFLCVMFITLCIRPNGWVLIPIALSFFMIDFFRNSFLKTLGVIAVITGFVLCIFFLPFTNRSIQNIGTQKILMNDVLLNGEVIPDHKELRVNMPRDSTLMKKNWTHSIYYIARHPLAYAKLATLRAVTELFQIRRPWYSAKYSLRWYFWLFPAYFFAMLGLFFFRRMISVKVILAIILAHLLIISVTFADHDARFLNYFLPLIYVLSGCGFTFLFYKLIPQGKQNS